MAFSVWPDFDVEWLTTWLFEKDLFTLVGFMAGSICAMPKWVDEKQLAPGKMEKELQKCIREMIHEVSIILLLLILMTELISIIFGFTAS